MGTRKAKGKNAKAAKKPAKKNEAKKRQVDIVKVRENINNMVGSSARKIASKVIENAKGTGPGQLASAKYLFEAVGLYPPTEETAGQPKEDSLAVRLLNCMGLPTEPVVRDDDDAPIKLTLDEQETAGEAETDDSPQAEDKSEPQTDSEGVDENKAE